jgi:hypothetical protein
MLVPKVCSTVSAILVTLVVAVLLVWGKMTVTGKHIRSAVAYDPVDHPHDPKNEHQDWTNDAIRSLQTAVTSCDVPGEGIIASSWNGATCVQSSLNDCCGPLINYTTCTTYQPYPGKWSSGVCSGYEQSECCVVETGYTDLIFDTCDEPDEQIPGQWDTDGTCAGYYLSDCCGQIQNFTTCTTDKPYPGKWSSGVCSGYFESDCCFEETGYTDIIFETCDEPDEQLTGRWDTDGTCTGYYLSECCGLLLNFTTCDEGYYPYLENWKNSTCSAYYESDCCVTFVTSCDEPGEGRIDAHFEWDSVNEYSQCYPGISECCGPLQNNSAIMCNGDEPLEWPGYWNDGVCSVAVESGVVIVQSDCCYHENGIIEVEQQWLLCSLVFIGLLSIGERNIACNSD